MVHRASVNTSILLLKISLQVADFSDDSESHESSRGSEGLCAKDMSTRTQSSLFT